MAAYYIYMDQGIAANLAHHTLCSGQFWLPPDVTLIGERDEKALSMWM